MWWTAGEPMAYLGKVRCPLPENELSTSVQDAKRTAYPGPDEYVTIAARATVESVVSI